MNIQLLFHNLAQKGVKLAANGNLLDVDAPKGILTTELRDSIIEHKAEILELLRENSHNSSVLPTIIPEPDQIYQPFPLTDMQHAFWVGRSGIFELGNVANHGYYEIEGENIDLARLNGGLQKLIDRHEMLRAVVLPDGQQQILETVPPYQIKVLDLQGQDKNAIAQRGRSPIASELAAIRDLLSHQVLPADRFPLFDFRVTLLNESRFRLHISYDLQIFDAWSLFRLFDEWHQLYQNPEIEFKPLEISFRDYVLAEQTIQKTEIYERSRDYWFSRLDSLPPAPELPLAKHPQALEHHLTKRYRGGLEKTQWQQLKQKAAQIGLTPSGILLAAFSEIVTLWSKNSQFTINLALFNRLPLHSQVSELLGDFTSVTLLAVDNSQSESFSDRALRLQNQLWQDLEHRYISGVQVIRELARRKGIAPSAMPVVFTSTLGFSSLGQDTLTFSRFGELVYGISQASQAWMDIQVWEEKETLTFNWDVVEELFCEDLIDDMFAAYCSFLKKLANEDLVWTETNRQLIPPEQLLQREKINNTARSIPETTLQTLFEKQVAIQPQAPAVITTESVLTYQELSAKADRVADRLRSLGVLPNRLVAIVMEKGWEQIVAVMGIINSGAAYVPIDPAFPKERRDYLLKNSEAKIVLTQSWLDKSLEWSENITRICIDRPIPSSSIPTPPPLQNSDDLAYVIYTSGSTGVPKGVMITHRNVINMVVQTNRRFNVGKSDRILAATALHHDLSVYDIFGLLSAGGTVVIPDRALVKDPSHWAELIAKEKVTLWNSVPAMMEMLVEYLRSPNIASTLQSLRLAILGGDWLPLTLPDRLRNLAPEVEILSIGGPTETTVWNIGYLIEKIASNWKSIPYGKPMANAKYYILNEALEDCPVWVAGQMYCAGVQLAKGYWQDEEKTKANFIIHPRTKERIYRTGDLGCYLPDGNIEFLGRVDFQIEIRGYRIEAGEIEVILRQHPAVKAAVVVAVGKQSQKESLFAYLIPKSLSKPTSEELRGFLGTKLPEYMIPSAFIFLDAFPLSANGKVDRRALPNPETLLQKIKTYIPPQNEIEQAIADVWKRVLDLEKVGSDNNFFEIGGNSLLITQVYTKLKNALPDRLENQISIVDLFKYSTIRSLAQHLSQSQATTTPENSNLVKQLTAGKNRLQQRLQKSKTISN